LRVTAPVSFGTHFLGPVFAEFARRFLELEIAVDYEDRYVNLWSDCLNERQGLPCGRA
jgi:DNA-binding transcriptional LysR family regulator